MKRKSEKCSGLVGKIIWMISQTESERKECGSGHVVVSESRQKAYCQNSKLTSLCIVYPKYHQITQYELGKTPISPGHLEVHKSESLFAKTHNKGKRMIWKTHKPEIKLSLKKTPKTQQNPKNLPPFLLYLEFFHNGFETVMISSRSTCGYPS